jgi:Putative quorum-sensing-regulated virulence factor
MILSFGKYEGEDIRDVPREYLEWLADQARRNSKAYDAELERRDLLEQSNCSMVDRIVQVGFRELAKQLHPDQGGNSKDFIDLRAAHERLKEMLG